jgi:hypothetical protein
MKTISNLRMKLRNHTRWIAATFVLAMTTGTWLGLDYVLPNPPGGFSSGQSRLGWYLGSGQWHADVRTLAAMTHFAFYPDNTVLPTTDPATNNKVAGAAQPLPASGAARAGAGNPS